MNCQPVCRWGAPFENDYCSHREKSVAELVTVSVAAAAAAVRIRVFTSSLPALLAKGDDFRLIVLASLPP